jgi:LuxR family quorum sensing-dependent transcriptional regulator
MFDATDQIHMQDPNIAIERHTLDFVQSVEAMDDAQAIADAFQQFVVGLGMRTACCMKVPEQGEDVSEHVLMNTNPEGFVEQYVERDFVKRDPMVVEMFRTYRPYAWSDVLERREFDKLEKEIFHSGSDFKMNFGFVVPIYGVSGYTGLASITAESDELTQPTRAALQLSSIYVHNKLLALRRSGEVKRINLTPRESECLRWAACGKSDWDISEILKISEKTVNFHIENAKRKFGVATRVQLVVAAIRQGTLLPY